ncbi:MAG: M23 family metallopeptidase [Clostridia bacterium]|mgnify:FL=1
MERVMSVEDKIRRAEEIYYKRRQQEVPMREMMRKTPTKKNDIRLIKKMIKQIIVCMIIYGIFYLIVNSNYIFSEDFTNKVKEILSQDINFSQVYSVVSNRINEIYKQTIKEESQNEENEEQNKDIINNDENIGGAEENLTTVETPDSEIVQEQIPENETSGLSQMEQDANHIKNTISFIKPVNGKISSVFGLRNPTTSTVPKDHKGTDIATETGSKIVSATDGKVVLVSTTGDYGNHLKIQTNDVIIVYAHCNKLYVNEGDIIKQGQEIAEVGSTGNTTGPHLHFEVRYQNRYVDPQLILEL